MWLGESKHSLDDKGRLSVPRRLLTGQAFGGDGRLALIVTQGFEGALFVFTESAFQQAISRLDTQAFAGPEKRTMQRLFFSKAQRVELDEKNRLLIPGELKDLAGIGRDVVLVGLVDRAEIWPEDKWAAFQTSHASEFEQLDRVLMGDGSVARASVADASGGGVSSGRGAGAPPR
jgi:MraZ protein